jgi:hypothetical protein
MGAGEDVAATGAPEVRKTRDESGLFLRGWRRRMQERVDARQSELAGLAQVPLAFVLAKESARAA